MWNLISFSFFTSSPHSLRSNIWRKKYGRHKTREHTRRNNESNREGESAPIHAMNRPKKQVENELNYWALPASSPPPLHHPVEVYHFIIDKHSINFINIDFRAKRARESERVRESNVIDVFVCQQQMHMLFDCIYTCVFCCSFSRLLQKTAWHHFAEWDLLFVHWTNTVCVCVQENRFSDNTKTSFFLSACFELSEFFSPIQYNTDFGRKKRALHIVPFDSVQFRKNWILSRSLSLFLCLSFLPSFIARSRFSRPFRLLPLSFVHNHFKSMDQWE